MLFLLLLLIKVVVVASEVPWWTKVQNDNQGDDFNSADQEPVEPHRRASLWNYTKGPELILRHGYPLERHQVISDDGYITTLYRIPYSRLQTAEANKGKKKVALLIHGFLGDGFAWVSNGRDKALPFRLVDTGGVDVWLTNNRGTFHSLDHTNLSWKTHHRYWNYSFHEIGTDIPKIIDYVLKVTGEEDLYVVGHSMGGTTFMVGMSMFPEYNDKVRTFIGLAPAVYSGNGTSPIQAFYPALLSQQGFFDRIMGKPLLAPELLPLVHLLGNFCTKAEASSWLCLAIINSIFGFDFEEVNYEDTFTSDVVGMIPSSVSMKTMYHLLQLATSGKFTMYDYGKRNLQVYGQKTPPEYPVHKITCPVVLFCGHRDTLVHCIDVERLYKDLPNGKEFKEVGWRKFNHLDFVFAKDINELLNDRIVEIIDKDLFYEPKGV